MCHAARQRSSRFDVCASIIVVFSSKHANHSMSVSDRREVDLASEENLPQFSIDCHETLQYLYDQVSNGNLRRAAGGLDGYPTPEGGSRSPSSCCTVHNSNSEDEEIVVDGHQ